jgi:hypothetical protein
MAVTLSQRVHWLTSLADPKAIAFAHSFLAISASVSRGLVMDGDWLRQCDRHIAAA